jgi:DNA-binding NarL/FixJ family response regulator
MVARHFGARAAAFQGKVPTLGPRDRSNPLAAWDDTNGVTLDALRGLTPRQREVLQVLMQGKSNKRICRILNLAEPTVKSHVAAILKALEVSSRTEAVLKLSRASAPVMSNTGTPYTYLGYVPTGSSLTFR